MSIWLKRIWLHRAMYLFLLPAIVFFILFSYIPMTGLILAFKEYRFNGGLYGGPWVGWKYFERFFHDSYSMNYIRNTLSISFFKLFLALPFPILFALQINEIRSSRMRSLFQGVMYLPHFLSWAVVIGILQRIIAPETGLLNEWIHALGGHGSTFFMMDKHYFYPIMFWSYIWKEIGWNSIIYFAAIAGINPALYEAARMDGAGRFRQIWHITLPGIRPTILILFIMSLSSILSAGFDQIYLLQNPANAEVAQILDTYIIHVGIQDAQFGYATAVGLMQGVIGLLLVVTVNQLCKKWFEVSLW
ncbi:ABC transporter permease [Paenibacillus wenxiniae]|uniref:ABC transporter permease n=1 Tax=Paenibacillus wenxiniae TaxID=1636843 RepID=A0ABW4RHV6_9BACL